MRSDAFWRWHDWIWRAYDWAMRLGLWGFTVSVIGGGVIGTLFRYDGWDPPVVLLAALIAFAAIAVVYLAFCAFWDRRQEKLLTKPPSVILERQAAISEDIPNLRVADDPATIALFEAPEADRLLPLLEGDKLFAWARPMGRGEPPLTKISGAQWKTFFFLFAPKQAHDMRNQTFLKSKARQESFYYDVYFNRSQIERAWPVISDVWKPVYLIIKYISDKTNDTDSKNCFPIARRALRQAAYNKKVDLRGRKQLADKRVFREGEYSDIHTDIDSDYWINSEINALATSVEAQTQYHTDPQTASAWGPKGLDERNRYAELFVNWPQVLREWPA